MKKEKRKVDAETNEIQKSTGRAQKDGK